MLEVEPCRQCGSTEMKMAETADKLSPTSFENQSPGVCTIDMSPLTYRFATRYLLEHAFIAISNRRDVADCRDLVYS